MKKNSSQFIPYYEHNILAAFSTIKNGMSFFFLTLPKSVLLPVGLFKKKKKLEA